MKFSNWTGIVVDDLAHKFSELISYFECYKHHRQPLASKVVKLRLFHRHFLHASPTATCNSIYTESSTKRAYEALKAIAGSFA